MQARVLHLNLDEAWPGQPLPIPALDAQEWGPRLRFSAPPRLIENFYEEYLGRLAPFLLYGSGDFHHLTALWLRRVTEPVIVVSFDNHPDWDVRPPKWCCGSWVNRALELPSVQRISVWGCGNFECWWPRQVFGNRRAEREGRLEVHPWADERSPKDQKRRGAILRASWRDRFEQFLLTISGAALYVTIDLDCLIEQDAITNWESGRFTTEDLTWAISRLRQVGPIVGGDICGAFSTPKYARWKQRFVAEVDHPKLTRSSSEQVRKINQATLEKLWPILTD